MCCTTSEEGCTEGEKGKHRHPKGGEEKAPEVIGGTVSPVKRSRREGTTIPKEGMETEAPAQRCVAVLPSILCKAGAVFPLPFAYCCFPVLTIWSDGALSSCSSSSSCFFSGGAFTLSPVVLSSLSHHGWWKCAPAFSCVVPMSFLLLGGNIYIYVSLH